MTFRRSDSEEPGSSRWRRRHRSELLACGVPVALLDSDRALTYVLLHGDDPQSGWTSAWLSDDEAARLLALLQRIIPESTGYDLIAELERRQRS